MSLTLLCHNKLLGQRIPRAYLWLWSRLVFAVVVSGPDGKLALVPFHMLRDPNVACLEGIACQAHEEHILGCKIFWGGVRFGTGRNFDYLPAFSFCRDTWPCRCCPWPLLRRPSRAQTGTFDAPSTDVSIFWGPTHGRYPKITNMRLWGLDRAYAIQQTIWPTWRMTSPRRSLVRSQPSRRERWRASLAFRGTDRHTSKPSLISPTWENLDNSVCQRKFLKSKQIELDGKETNNVFIKSTLVWSCLDGNVDCTSLSEEQERRSLRSSWYLVILQLVFCSDVDHTWQS